MPTRNIYSQILESALEIHRGFWLVDFGGPKLVGGPFRAILNGAEHVDALYAEVMAYLGGTWDGLSFFRAYRCDDPSTGEVEFFEYRQDHRFHAASITRIGSTIYERAILFQLAVGTRDHTGATLIRRAMKALRAPGGNSPDGADYFDEAAPHEGFLGRVLTNFKRNRVAPDKPLFLKIRRVARGADGEFAATTYELPQGFRNQQGDIKKMIANNIEPSWANAEQCEAKPLRSIISDHARKRLFHLRLTAEGDPGGLAIDLGVHGYIAVSLDDALSQARLDVEHCLDRLLELMRADVRIAS